MRIPAVPLITNDPYFSVWSASDFLYDSDTMNWTGASKRITGYIEIDGERFCFMGKEENEPESKCIQAITQKSFEITPTSSTYTFENDKIEFAVKFTSPLLLDDLDLVSRPCTFISFCAKSNDGSSHIVKIDVSFDEGFCYDGEASHKMKGDVQNTQLYQTAWMGRAKQTPLSHSGDHTTIDWGYLYVAVPNGKANVCYTEKNKRKVVTATNAFSVNENPVNTFMVAAYDDVLSIMYFDKAAKAYWARDGKNIYEMLETSINEYSDIMERCQEFDKKLMEDAKKLGGDEYAVICAVAYRQTIAAHKLITDQDGKVIFLSKECDSNGCIGTVDVSYPSIPLYLIYNKELVRGMIRPVLKFANYPVWEYDFAPHDVGCYPYATGQVYGMKYNDGFETGDVYPQLYTYPESFGIYPLRHQMPVEECGNMLIMIANVMDDIIFENEIKDQIPLLTKWVNYLIEFGEDPAEQLCTDDFAGHLAHNVNLSAKAIMGIAAFSIILERLGKKEVSQEYKEKAKNMAVSWENRCNRGDHTKLTFDNEDGWSLKYNLVWDKVFKTNLFSDKIIQNEIAWYKEMQNQYGVPLDSRKEYTKSDWVLWCAAIADNKEDRMALIKPVYHYLHETRSRVPFSDWYQTKTGDTCGFKNRTVQGGVFMPLLVGEE